MYISTSPDSLAGLSPPTLPIQHMLQNCTQRAERTDRPQTPFPSCAERVPVSTWCQHLLSHLLPVYRNCITHIYRTSGPHSMAAPQKMLMLWPEGSHSVSPKIQEQQMKSSSSSCLLHSPTLHAAKLLITKIALVCYGLKPVLRGSVKATSPKEGAQNCSTLLGCLLASHAKGVVVSQVRHQASLEPASGHHLQPPPFQPLAI